MQYIYTNGNSTIPRQEIMEETGFSDRQLENLNSISIGLGLLKPRVYKLTELGIEISRKDPFFDNDETLWILHYIISCNPKYIVWHRLVNIVFAQHEMTSSEAIRQYFNDLKEYYSEKSIKSHLTKEIRSVLNAYTEQLFNRLGILSKHNNNSYVVGANVNVSFLSFLYMVLYYKGFIGWNASSIDIDAISTNPNSPGKVLNIPLKKIEELLDRAHDNGFIRLEKFGDLDQIRFDENLTKEMILKKIYGD